MSPKKTIQPSRALLGAMGYGMTRAAVTGFKPEKMRRFEVTFEGTFTIDVSDALLRECNTDDWRKQMWHLVDDVDFAEHLAFAMGIRGFWLEQMDGFADQPKERVRIVEEPGWEIEGREIKP